MNTHYKDFKINILIIQVVLLLLFLPSIVGCKKYLDAKPDQKLVIPSSFKDLELLLDNYDALNIRFRPVSEVCADNYYLTDAGWGGATEAHRNYYLWQPFDDVIADWSLPYGTILYLNVILESLTSIEFPEGERQRFNYVKGATLFHRAFNYFNLAELYAPVYDKTNASQQLGLPLRLNSNTDEISVRSTVKETYDLIISDLKESQRLLPELSNLKYRVTKAASYGLLARVYLAMQEYEKSGAYADSCLQLYNTLMNYNSSSFVNANHATIPILQWNPEVIFDAMTATPSALARTRAKVDTLLFASYDLNDIRRTAFFRQNSDGSYHFKGNYTGSSGAKLFVGITTDEMYLIRAECYARAGNKDAAINDLNTLMVTRWKNNGTWTSFAAANADEALTAILKERRKELLYRGLRWSDLRRLNKEDRFQTTLTRYINGQAYTLLTNSPRYTLLIDRTAIELSGMQQNP